MYTYNVAGIIIIIIIICVEFTFRFIEKLKRFPFNDG